MIERLNELLLTVQRPARYIGGEWNAVKKDWTDDKIKVLLAFPDVYEVGMSHLGLKILYGILNGRKDCLCERVFSPWVDFEDVLRKNRIPLFSLESKRSIGEFDIIGFSLGYELNYTNVLNILDLANVPKRSSERTGRDPLIIAGGPACYNPEPIAEFIDLFLIGDGEEAISEMIDLCVDLKRSRCGISRREILKEYSKIRGVYVPSLYQVEYNQDNTIKKFLSSEKGIPQKIEKRRVRDLNDSFYPTQQIVPYLQIVHDRIALEIMRGCKHSCRFCQAATTYRPCRERTKDSILKLAEETYKTTGYEEISLLSLSSADHSRISEIIEGLNRTFKGKAVSVSIPSLRIEDIIKGLPALISEVKKSGLTFAPEAGSEHLRCVINKDIDIGKLFEAVSESYKKGWQRIKLYFMIGLPNEKEEDLLDMIELIKKISQLKKDIDGRAAYVRASINAFVPKPHTPFQWEGMEGMEDLFRKEKLLKERIRFASVGKMVKLDFHSFQMSYLEAVFSRGDRRLSEVIYDAWESGARFDGWQDVFDFALWRNSFNRVGIDPDFYVKRIRRFDEVLPWGLIDIGLNKEWLSKEAPHRGGGGAWGA